MSRIGVQIDLYGAVEISPIGLGCDVLEQDALIVS